MSEPQTMPLPVKLTDEERRQKGVELANKVRHIETLKGELQRLTKKYKTDIEKAEGERIELADIVANGKETRPVEVYERKYYHDATAVTYRADTHDVVCTRALNESELKAHRQPPLPLPEPDEKAEEKSEAQAAETTAEATTETPADAAPVEEAKPAINPEEREAFKQALHNLREERERLRARRKGLPNMPFQKCPACGTELNKRIALSHGDGCDLVAQLLTELDAESEKDGDPAESDPAPAAEEKKREETEAADEILGPAAEEGKASVH